MNRLRSWLRPWLVGAMTIVATAVPAGSSHAAADGVDTPGVMRDARWYLSNTFGGTGDHIFTYGLDGDHAVVGDWNGDGIDTPGVVRGDRWYLTNAYGGGGQIEFAYGLAGDVPVVGDWNGDGIDTPGVMRGDGWWLSNSFGGTGDVIFAYGLAGDVPVVGDWNGDGIDTPGVMRGDGWWLSNSFGGTGDVIFKYGLAGDQPVVGDWDGDTAYEEPGDADPSPPGDQDWSDTIWAGSGEPSDRELQMIEGVPNVVNRYAPQVRLHLSEDRFPASARTGFIRFSELRWAHDAGCDDFRAARAGAINSFELGHGGYRHRQTDGACNHYGATYYSDQVTRPREGTRAAGLEFDEGFFLDIPELLEDTVHRGNHDLATVPAYFEYGDLAGGGHYATYWFFYPYNEGSAGFNHEGDWERVAIRFSSTNRPVEMALYRHGCQPVEVAWSGLFKVSGTDHPIVWSALGSHASYATTGFHENCEASQLYDATNNGPSSTHWWNTWRWLANVRRQPWLRFGGAWGEVGSDWPGLAPGTTTGPLGPYHKTPTPWCPCTPVN